jgi:hypothetical protein
MVKKCNAHCAVIMKDETKEIKILLPMTAYRFLQLLGFIRSQPPSSLASNMLQNYFERLETRQWIREAIALIAERQGRSPEQVEKEVWGRD